MEVSPLVLIVVVGVVMAFDSAVWAIGHAHRTWRRGFSLLQLLFSFTIAALLIGAFSAWFHLFAN
jgi:hypothetical protein